MSIFVNDVEVLHKQSFDDPKFEFTTNIDWPSIVTIKVGNKGPNDTEVDAEGNILNDKYIKLDEIIVDRIPIHILSLMNVTLDTQNDKIMTNYWGFNGEVVLDFNTQDSLLWHLIALESIANKDEKFHVKTEHGDDAGMGTIF